MKSFFLIAIPFILIGCRSGTGEEISDDSKDTTDFSRTIQLPEEEVVLLPQAREYAVNWLHYITAQNEIDRLKGADVHQVIQNAGPLSQIMGSLQTSVPDSLRSTEVEARLNVLVTKSKVLEQLASRRTKDPKAIAKIAEEIPVEFNNFKIQLNEIFLKSIEDFEKELDRLQEELGEEQKS